MDFGPIQFVQFVRLFEMLGDGWVAIIVYGLFAGFLARLITTRESKVGLLSSALLGIAGALLGFFVAHWAGFDLESAGMRFVAAFTGSLLIAILGGVLLRRRRSDPD